MRLTVEKNRQAIERYRHIKRARGSKAVRCAATFPGSARKCTLAKGHRGPHVAHGLFRKVLAVWDGGPEAPPTQSPTRRASGGVARSPSGRRRPIGLRGGRPAGVLKPLLSRLVNVVSSVEQLVFLVLFLAFVGFAVHWFLLIAG